MSKICLRLCQIREVKAALFDFFFDLWKYQRLVTNSGMMTVTSSPEDSISTVLILSTTGVITERKAIFTRIGENGYGLEEIIKFSIYFLDF